ncbi:hypothetical protein D3C85_1041540 [compost metagenome]
MNIDFEFLLGDDVLSTNPAIQASSLRNEVLYVTSDVSALVAVTTAVCDLEAISETAESRRTIQFCGDDYGNVVEVVSTGFAENSTNLVAPVAQSTNFDLVQRTQLVRKVDLATTDLCTDSSEVSVIRKGRFDNQPEGVVMGGIRNNLQLFVEVCFVQILEDSNCFLRIIEVDGIVEDTINKLDYLFVSENNSSHETTPYAISVFITYYRIEVRVSQLFL